MITIEIIVENTLQNYHNSVSFAGTYDNNTNTINSNKLKIYFLIKVAGISFSHNDFIWFICSQWILNVEIYMYVIYICTLSQTTAGPIVCGMHIILIIFVFSTFDRCLFWHAVRAILHIFWRRLRQPLLFQSQPRLLDRLSGTPIPEVLVISFPSPFLLGQSVVVVMLKKCTVVLPPFQKGQNMFRPCHHHRETPPLNPVIHELSLVSFSLLLFVRLHI